VFDVLVFALHISVASARRSSLHRSVKVPKAMFIRRGGCCFYFVSSVDRCDVKDAFSTYRRLVYVADSLGEALPACVIRGKYEAALLLSLDGAISSPVNRLRAST